MAQYTFGFGVTNPGKQDDLGGNLWGLQLKNYEGSTVDANMRIPGLDLTKINLRYNIMGWTQVAPQQMARILIEIVVTQDLEQDEIDLISITSPEGVMFNDPSSVSVGPDALPLTAT